MRVAKTADWRDAIPFDTPMIVADVIPGDPTRCSMCGSDSELRSRTELWAVKHRHPHHHDGYVRFYCLEHRPRVAQTESRPAPTVGRTERRAPVRRSAPVVEKQRAVCPDCFVEVAATGICGVCGRPAY